MCIVLLFIDINSDDDRHNRKVPRKNTLKTTEGVHSIKIVQVNNFQLVLRTLYPMLDGRTYTNVRI